jgi:hypothetical protein
MITFNGWHGKYRGGRTYLNLICKNGHSYNTTSIDKLLSCNRGCRSCVAVNLSRLYTPPEEDTIDDFMKGGKFKEGTIFCKEGKKWTYKCPVCSHDDIVVKGLCSGVFIGRQEKMKAGQLSCRCSPKWSGWNQEIRTFQISHLLIGSSLTFIGWSGSDFGEHSKITINCKEHGNHTLTLGSFLYNGTRCPQCSKTGFNKSKPSIFYILKIDGKYSNFTGYGISGNINTRLKVHGENLNSAGYSITDKYLVKGSGEDIFKLESAVKKDFAKFSQSVEGFKREATYYENYDKLIEYAVNYIKEKTCQA